MVEAGKDESDIEKLKVRLTERSRELTPETR